jgi:hypothetical protein
MADNQNRYDAPERIWLNWTPGAAVTSGPLTQHPDYTGYVRIDSASASPLGAESMRQAAYDSLFLHPGFIRTIGGQNFKAVKLEDAAEGIRAIPGPTHADLLAHALRLPEVARAVAAICIVLIISDRNHVAWDEARNALAALEAHYAK